MSEANRPVSGWVVQIEPGVWLSPWGRTLVEANAKRFKSARAGDDPRSQHHDGPQVGMAEHRRHGRDDRREERTVNELVLMPNVIEALFERTNFGGAEKTDVGRRGLMCECVMKRASGYHDGHTITTICKNAGLLNHKGNPAKGAVRWAFDQLYHYGGGPTILERLQNNSITGAR